MITTELFLEFLLSIALGILIGLEREKAHQKNKTPIFAGIRTFALITMFGFISGYLSTTLETPIINFLSIILLTLLIIFAYTFSFKEYHSLGITTEISAFLAFLIGLLIYYGNESFAITIAIVTVLILSLTKPLHHWARTVKQYELFDTLKFAIIAFIILPLLPNKGFGYLESFNPYQIWLMVVFVSGIGYIGYILTKLIGTKRGIGLTGLIGGLVSSTAVTSALSEKSKKIKNNALLFGVIVSSSIMFIRILFEIFVFNIHLFVKLLIPLTSMAITGIIISLFFYTEKSKPTKVELISPFTLKPALVFGGFFALVIFLSKVTLEHFVSQGIYVVSLFSALADVDAITLTISNLKTLSPEIATTAIIIAAITNTIVKGGIAYLFGSKEFSKKIILSFSIMITIGLLSLLFI